MKPIFQILLFFLFFFLNNFNSNAQEGQLAKANKNYEQFSYIKASDIYKDVVAAGYKSEELYENLANTYYFNANYEEASKWYSELFILNPEPPFIYYLRFSQSLRVIGESDKAAVYYNLFLKKTRSNDLKLKSAKDYEAIINNDSITYTLKNLALNTDGVDFGASFTLDNQIIFASTRDTTNISKRRKRHAWNELAYMDLYQATIYENDSIGIPYKLNGDINTGNHETTACFTNDLKTIYFTRNNTTSIEKSNTQHLKIYRASLVDGVWTNIQDLAINADVFSNAHPFLNKDNSILYFASDRPGGFGLIDLYSVAINSDGSLGDVINLGVPINTAGRDSFPFITKDDELYFSSDGHYGLGGYDVFYADLTQEEISLINVGSPINSNYDDVSFSINKDIGKGYISSNRPGGKGNDDIYSFEQHIPEERTCTLFGKVTDKETGLSIQDARIIIYKENLTPVLELQTDTDGNYTTIIDCNKYFIVRAEKETYNSEESFVITELEENELNLELKRNEYPIAVDVDIADILNTNNIYFDFDKYNILPKAEIQLQKIVSTLQKYPNLKIDVRSHTDSRGGDSYNLRLSDHRVKSTITYLIDHGIESSRLSGRGYGETELVNKCANGVVCSEESHQENRRSEFIIIEK